MANPTLTWKINPDRGTIDFGRLSPFAGNTYDLSITGGATGVGYTAYVMDDDGVECLAKSVTASGATTIAFDSTALHDAFVRDMHEIKPMHVIVRDQEKTVAEGDLPVEWNPLWEDTATGEVYSMRGPKGDNGTDGVGIRSIDLVEARELGNVYRVSLTNGTHHDIVAPKGERGAMGATATSGYIQDADGNYHAVTIVTNSAGEYTLKIATETADPSSISAVDIGSEQTITGVKTFEASPVVPDSSALDDTGKALNNRSFFTKVAKWWEGILSSSIIFNQGVSFKNQVTVTGGDDATMQILANPNRIVAYAPITTSSTITATGGVTANVTGNLTGNVTGNLTGNVTGDVTGNVAGVVTASAGSTAVTPDFGDSSTKIATTAFVQASRPAVVKTSVVQMTTSGTGSATITGLTVGRTYHVIFTLMCQGVTATRGFYYRVASNGATIATATPLLSGVVSKPTLNAIEFDFTATATGVALDFMDLPGITGTASYKLFNSVIVTVYAA